MPQGNNEKINKLSDLIARFREAVTENAREAAWREVDSFLEQECAPPQQTHSHG